MSSAKNGNGKRPAQQANGSGRAKRQRIERPPGPLDRQPTDIAAVAISQKQITRKPAIDYARDGTSCRVRHRERIGTILGSVAFAVNTFAVNPGLAASFPWLSALAQRFESYRFNRLCFQYRTKSATTGTGDVILALDYDAADAAPVTSVQAEGFAETRSCAPWQDLDHESQKLNLHKLLSHYVRTEALAANLDIKTYDIGNLFVCTENQPSAALAGYLYVEYDVEFFTPQLNSDLIGPLYGGRVTGNGVFGAANPFGTTAAADAQAVGLSVDGASVFTLAVPGTYSLAATVAGTTITTIIPTAITNCTVTLRAASIANAAATNATSIYEVVSTGANATFSYAAAGAATVTGASLYVGRAPANSFA